MSMILIKSKASPVHNQLIQLVFASLLVLLKMPMPYAEKTLCERRLATLPSAPGLFYYQRIELNSAAPCAERCVDDWEFCRSAVLIEDIRNKSLCQLYSGSFESRIPLNLPAFAPLQADPNRLLPITLVELTDAPCSSKFARQSTIFDQISANAREQLRMIPGPAVRNRLDIAAVHNSEKATKNDNESVDQHEQANTAGDATERTEKASTVDQTYLVPFSSASSSSIADQPHHQLTSSSSSSSSNGYSVPLGHHHQPAPLQFPPNGLPIQPVFVSRGNNNQYQYQQQYNFGCPNGICSRIGAKLNTFNNHNDDDTVTQPPCAARKSSDPCAPRIGESTDREKNNNLWTEWTEWTHCSRSCGGGEQMKRRSCKSGVDDQCVGPPIESRPCNDEQCPTWSNWGSWTECSATCGTGTQRRVRECESPRHNANAAICPIGSGVEHRECELRSCPEWSQWEPWSACSKSCGAGESVRRRQCRNAASKDECQGGDVERLLCNTQLCPAWTTWTEWSACSNSCGTGGTQSRKRECRYAGELSNECTGAAKDEKQCKQLEACPSWAEWGEWSDCTASCGHGQQSRVRKCLGHGCAGNEKEVRSCQKATCPYFEQWSEWGGCSVTCGRGFCERRRKCIKFNDVDLRRDDNKKLVPYEGMMPVREEMVDGTKREKGGGPEDITSVDTIRPRTLEVIQSSAVQRRSPLISTKLALLNEEEDGFVVDHSETAPPKLYDTKIVPISAGDCVGPSVERKACDAGPCCKWTQWSSWSDCVVQCGSTGYRDRTRRCELTQTETETKMDDGLAAGTTVQQQFVSSRNFAFGTSGVLRCANTICRGESTQTESCAIPTPKTICGQDQPMFDQRLPKVPILRAKMKPDLSLLREDIGAKENDDDSSYITAPKFGRRAVDMKKLANEEDAGNFNEQHEHNIDDADDDLIETETVKRSSPSANEAKENGAVTATTTVDDEQQQHNCTWTEWSAWSECGGVECLKRRSRTCISSPITDENNKCHCSGNHMQQTKCPPDECQQQNSDEMAGKAASSPGITTTMKKDENKSASPSSFIKRLQLIPRHKTSEVEKRREAERRTNRHQKNAQQNDDFPSAVHEVEAPPTLTDQPNDSAKLIRISGLQIGSNGDQQEEQRVPSSTTATDECAVDDWLPWSEWSACDGLCANDGIRRPPAERQRTRHRRCACERGCAGIAEESISCALTNCS